MARPSLRSYGAGSLQRWGQNRPPARSRPAGRAAVVLSLVWLGLVGLLALGADLLPLAPYDQLSVDAPLTRPGLRWPEFLGTDRLGRSMLSRLVYGARISLMVGLLAVALAMCLGGAIGVLAGYVGRWFDRVVGALTDSLLAFPPLVLLISLTATAGARIPTVAVGLAMIVTPGFVRIARANTLSVVNANYIAAATVYGSRRRRILVREVLPNVAAPVLAYGVIVMAVVVVAEGTLSFLGVGLPPPNPSWGSMIAAGQPYLSSAPLMVFLPGAFLLATIWSLSTTGQWLGRVMSHDR